MRSLSYAAAPAAGGPVLPAHAGRRRAFVRCERCLRRRQSRAMKPSNYSLQTRYLHYRGACQLCAMPMHLVERYTPFRTVYYTDVPGQVITRCARCNWPLDHDAQPDAMQRFKLLA